jgi:quercetin dioxygenase-like cupin family protein
VSETIIVDAASRPRALNVVGEHLTVLASGAQTGSYEIFHQAGPEGSGPPPHNHPWDEAFYVIRGEIAFGHGDRELVARPGTLVHLPAGTTHWFRFGPGGGEMISMTSREGASHMFTDFDREISPENPDFARLTELGGRYGLAVPAPAG